MLPGIYLKPLPPGQKICIPRIIDERIVLDVASHLIPLFVKEENAPLHGDEALVFNDIPGDRMIHFDHPVSLRILELCMRTEHSKPLPLRVKIIGLRCFAYDGTDHIRA